MKNLIISLVLLTVTLFISCGKFINSTKEIVNYFKKTPEVEAIADAVKISLPIGYAAQIAMSAVNGDSLDPGITVLSNIVDSSGPALVTIPVTADRPLPVGSKTGTIIVAGYWLSMEEAAMSMIFTNFDITTSAADFKNIKTFFVIRKTEGTGTTAMYVNQWVNLVESPLDTNSVSKSEAIQKKAWADSIPEIDSTISVEQDVWIIMVKENNTPGDQTDDEYDMIGAGQYAGVGNSAYLIQLVVLGIPMKMSCRKNPVTNETYGGFALLNTFQVEAGKDPIMFPKVGKAVFTYHEQCDGTIDLSLATGCYIGNFGKSFPINLE